MQTFVWGECFWFKDLVKGVLKERWSPITHQGSTVLVVINCSEAVPSEIASRGTGELLIATFSEVYYRSLEKTSF